MPPLVPRKQGYNRGPSSLAKALAKQARPRRVDPATDKPSAGKPPMTVYETANEISEIRSILYSALRRMEILSSDLYSRNVKDEIPF